MQLIYEGDWSTYEEWGAVRIYEDDRGCFYVEEGGHSVYSDPREPEWDAASRISMEEALQLIDEWDEIMKDGKNHPLA